MGNPFRPQRQTTHLMFLSIHNSFPLHTSHIQATYHQHHPPKPHSAYVQNTPDAALNNPHPPHFPTLFSPYSFPASTKPHAPSRFPIFPDFSPEEALPDPPCYNWTAKKSWLCAAPNSASHRQTLPLPRFRFHLPIPFPGSHIPRARLSLPACIRIPPLPLHPFLPPHTHKYLAAP